MKTNLFKKSMLIALTLVLAALPLTSVFAAPTTDTSTPPTDDKEVYSLIERAWKFETRAVERIGQRIDRAPTMIEKTQSMIDKAKANGKDVTALQAALDAYAQAIKDVAPMYDKAQSIVNQHAGFDADGKVTDREHARQTLKDLSAQLKEVRQQIGDPGKALREAIKAFREANKPGDTSNN